MTRTTQRSTRKRINRRPNRSLPARDSGRIRAGRVLAAQARIASGYYERPEVQDYLLEALLQELRRH
jgi:hypothetical protein